MTQPLLILVFVALPGLALLMTLYNLRVWPRGSTREAEPEERTKVSVLIPARNEADSIEACIRAIFANDYPMREVIVYDDRSTDRTGEILDNLQEEFPRLRVLAGEPLPPGWVGKPHACYRLSSEASADCLLFVDADTIVEETGIERLVSVLEDGLPEGADLVTAVPRQEFGSFGERLVVPLLHLTYTSWLPLTLVWRSNDPKLLAANGQLVAVRREALQDVGGFEAIQSDIVDDMALAARFKRESKKVVFADGYRMARCRMYESWSQVWRGFSKNLYEGLGESITRLVLVTVVYLIAFVAPYLGAVGWAAGSLGAQASSMALLGVGLNVALRSVLAVRFRHPIEGIVLHPIGVLVLVGIAINSVVWHLRGEIQWAGRTYTRRSER